MLAAGPPFRLRASDSQDAFHSGPLQEELDLPLGVPGVSVPTGGLKLARKEPAASSLLEDALVPLRISSHLSSLARWPSPGPGPASPPAGLSCTHRGVALGAPAWDQPSPWGQRQRRDRRARGAHCGGAPTHRRVRARTAVPTPPLRTHTQAARAKPAPRRTRAREPKESLE